MQNNAGWQAHHTKEMFAGKIAMQTEKQLQQQAVLARKTASSSVEVADRQPRMMCRGSRTRQSSWRMSWSRVVRTVYIHLVNNALGCFVFALMAFLQIIIAPLPTCVSVSCQG